MSLFDHSTKNARYGVMVRIVRTAAVGPIAAAAGLDFIMLDMEHGDYAIETVATICAAAPPELTVLVRVPELSRGYVSRVLDSGARGVMVPMVETAEQAAKLVGWSKFTPVGERGLCTGAGHTRYRTGTPASQIMESENREVIAIAQIETAAGIENIDAIAAVAGLDALLIGPNDLAVSLGSPGNPDTPRQDAAIERVAEAARRNGKIFGMHAPEKTLAKWAPRGLRLVMHSLDLTILNDGFRDAGIAARRAVER